MEWIFLLGEFSRCGLVQAVAGHYGLVGGDGFLAWAIPWGGGTGGDGAVVFFF
jgi:hypothetical protein